MPKVSIVVPVYNVEKYLDRCIQSLLNQTLSDIEIILVDDGSPDNCPQLCDDYARRDSRIKVVHKQNAGLGMACNSGLEMATGEYVAFCDSDDWVEKDMYQTMYETAIRDNADAVYTGLKQVDETGKFLGYLHHPDSYCVYEGSQIDDIIKDIISSKPIDRFDHGIQVSAKTVLYRRKLITDNNLRFVSEREYPSEDLIFNVLLLTHAKRVCVLPLYFYNYMINLNSISHTTVKPRHFEKIMESARLIDKLMRNRTIDVCESAHIRINRFIIGEARRFSKDVINSDLSSKEKKSKIKEISQNIYLRQAVKEYPLKDMPFVHLIALKALAGNHYYILKLLVRLK